MWLILGCGYVGAALAGRLRGEGEAVTAVRRTPSPDTVALDLADAGALADGAIVAYLAPPSPADRPFPTARRVVYVSSTGVYAPAGGAVVDEDWPVIAHPRLTAERTIAADVTLRPAGIYGPGRGVAARLRAGTYRVLDDGAAHVSRVHVDDLVDAIVRAGTAASLPHAIYNVADRDPCTAAAHADGVAARLGLPPPPRVPSATVSDEARAMLLADRRISAARLERDLGWTPRYPSWRDAPL